MVLRKIVNHILSKTHPVQCSKFCGPVVKPISNLLVWAEIVLVYCFVFFRKVRKEYWGLYRARKLNRGSIKLFRVMLYLGDVKSWNTVF